MKTQVFKQGSPEWLAWRNGGIGSSDAAVIAVHHGMCSKASWMHGVSRLYDEKVTGKSLEVENRVMRRGKEGEAAARAAFQAETGVTVMPLCGEMDANDKLRASFDGITLDGLELVEIKCPSAKVHALAKAGKIVGYYVPQVVHQSLVAWGLPADWPKEATIRFYSYFPETCDGALVTVAASEYREYAQTLYEHELAFLELVATRTPPCGDEYLSAAEYYLALDRRIKQLTEIRDGYKEKLIKVAAQRKAESVQGGGVTLLHTERAGSVDWPRLAAEYNIGPDEQERYRKKGSTFWQVRTDPKAKADWARLATEYSVAPVEQEACFLEDEEGTDPMSATQVAIAD